MQACQDAEAKRLLKEAEAAMETRKDFRRVMACQFFPRLRASSGKQTGNLEIRHIDPAPMFYSEHVFDKLFIFAVLSADSFSLQCPSKQSEKG